MKRWEGVGQDFTACVQGFCVRRLEEVPKVSRYIKMISKLAVALFDDVILISTQYKAGIAAFAVRRVIAMNSLSGDIRWCSHSDRRSPTTKGFTILLTMATMTVVTGNRLDPRATSPAGSNAVRGFRHLSRPSERVFSTI